MKIDELLDFLRTRRSIRRWKPDPIPDEYIEKMIEAARWAPSGANGQPWEFIIVRDAHVKRRLVAAALDQRFIEEAPVVIVVCAGETRSGQRYGQRGRSLYCLQDSAAATQNILLAAYDMKLGSCWIGAFNEGEVGKILKVPFGVRPIAIIPIGHPDETPSPPLRRPKKSLVHFQSF